MNKNRIATIGMAGLIVLAMAAGTSVAVAESPVQEVTLLAVHPQGPLDLFNIPSTIWIGGNEYQGTCAWIPVSGHETKKAGHGFADVYYDFPGLGSLQLWERYKSTHVAYEEYPDGGYHQSNVYSAIEVIIEGTGAFENAHGVFQIEGTTQWWFTPPTTLEFGAEFLCSGMIYGIELPE